jgi:predicted deacetylase
MTKYILRLDDIAENMVESNFLAVMDCCIKYNVKPLLGVIPNNKDKKLLKLQKIKFNLWEYLCCLQKKNQCNIALHGFEHVYQSFNYGLVGYKKQSEFAGLSYTDQLAKIKKGLKIFEKNHISTNTFMAPSHTFDHNTFKALKECHINSITDGCHFFPYMKNNILHVPQLTAVPRNFIFGIYTFCLHTNTMNKKQINYVVEFIRTNREKFVAFDSVVAPNLIPNYLNFIIERVITYILRIYRHTY